MVRNKPVKLSEEEHKLLKRIQEEVKYMGLVDCNDKLPEGIELESFNLGEIVGIGLRCFKLMLDEEIGSEVKNK